MTPERWQKIKPIFAAALQRAPADRAAFLSQACADDASLQNEVEKLLAQHEKDGSFIDSPAYQAVASTFLQQLRAGEMVGHYEVITSLGKGGMGEVYLVEDKRLGRKVALKFLQNGLSTNLQGLKRFEQEARAASGLNHPNILTIHEIGEIEGQPFIASEFVDGQTLRQRISMGPLSVQEAIDVGEQIASALAAAHSAGIVHRDIKPENIMLRNDGLVKVLDFGLAKLSETEAGPDDPTKNFIKTGSGTVMGTTAYMSPEQARGQIVDARSDLWSLGVVIYEMVTGQPPFTGLTMSDVLVSILERQPKSLTRISVNVPETLDWIVTKALTKEREDRYQTTRELLADVRRLKKRIEKGSDSDAGFAPSLISEPTVATDSSQAGKSRKRTLIVSLLVLAAISIAAAFIWKSGGWFNRGGKIAAPLVVLMDSPLPDRVYDPETRKKGGTNADDITDILRDLPILIEKENTSSLWHREDQVLQLKPSLIVVHRSCFFSANAGFDPESEAAQLGDSKLGGFLGYASLASPTTKFLVYTRRKEAQDVWLQQLQARFPQLHDRVAVLTISGGPDGATFRDPATGQALRQQVKQILGLR